MESTKTNSIPHVVIIGGGFGGLKAARELRNAPVRVTLIDRSNHHLFQPLLYQVATAGLNPADIAVPIRAVLKKNKNTEVILGSVTGIDVKKKAVMLEDRSIIYDFLVIATGARHSYFGKEQWSHCAPGLKSISDATEIRRRILLAFEKAEIEYDEEKRQAYLNFAIVGGGPTGVELAGSLSELAHAALAADFRHINPKSARIVLVEASPRILSSFPEALSLKAERSLTRLGVEVRTGARVEDITEEGVTIQGRLFPARTVIWAAGVQASSAGRWLEAPTDRAGRVQVNKDLTVPGHPEVFVIGDTAATVDDEGKPVPGVAPAALQQGRHAARVIKAKLSGKSEIPTFHYKDKGNLATIGRSAAVADLHWMWLSGFPAWLAWLLVHIVYLVGFRNRLLVLIQWAWSYLTFKRGARLIVDTRDC